MTLKLVLFFDVEFCIFVTVFREARVDPEKFTFIGAVGFGARERARVYGSDCWRCEPSLVVVKRSALFSYLKSAAVFARFRES